MKRIFLSLLTIGVVGVAGVGASRAFFSDKEVSKGNIIQAGTLDLTIDSEAHYDGLVCTIPLTGGPSVWQRENSEIPSQREDLIGKPCDGTWPLKSLVNERFFNLSDIKPGDEGENTISFHVTNDAWACAKINNMTTGHQTQDLAKGLYFTAWSDPDCNNKFDDKETLLFSNKVGPASDVLNGKTYALADSTTGLGPLKGNPDLNQKTCIGLRWCAGTMTVNETDHTIICDGSTLGNEAQGDSVQADITFDVVQSRNNPNFRCVVPVSDYLNIGDVASEVGHNLTEWSNPWVKPGWGGNYGGGSSDSTLRLLMGKGDINGCADPAARPAFFTMNAGVGTATKLTLEHLDGAVNDSFDVYVEGTKIGSYIATSTGGAEVWKTTTFTFPGKTGTVHVELLATQPVAGWCADWGQVAFSNAKLE
ncbi:hypothetical protein HYS03_01575 [Candidatus Woesebacteria bacterium]|nr:hypothetical protein [Candidatus Woesebacteria bacterium]QQG47008.1 MAG: hypothetical protein HY044_02615 [Candidatus Woesebacteria bacterium]